MTISLATPNQAGQVAGLLHAFSHEFGWPSPPLAKLLRRLVSYLDRPDIVVGVESEDGHPRAVAVATLAPSVYYDQPIGRLEVLYVVPQLRGQGIATALLEAVSAELRARGAAAFRVVVPANEESLAFWQEHGYSAASPHGVTMMMFSKDLEG